MESHIDHVGIRVVDLDAAVARFGEVFGLTVDTKVEMPERGLRSAFLRWGDVSLELLEIDRPGDPFQAEVDSRHHIGLGVVDLDAAIRAVADAGVGTVTPEPIVLAGRRTIFLDPATFADVRLQLVEIPSRDMAGRRDS